MGLDLVYLPSTAQLSIQRLPATSRIRSILSLVTKVKLREIACAAIQRSFSCIPSSKEVTGSTSWHGRRPFLFLSFGAKLSNKSALSLPYIMATSLSIGTVHGSLALMHLWNWSSQDRSFFVRFLIRICTRFLALEAFRGNGIKPGYSWIRCESHNSDGRCTQPLQINTRCKRKIF